MHVDILVLLASTHWPRSPCHLPGAGVLHPQGLVSKGSDLIVVLLRMTLGPITLGLPGGRC